MIKIPTQNEVIDAVKKGNPSSLEWFLYNYGKFKNENMRRNFIEDLEFMLNELAEENVRMRNALEYFAGHGLTEQSRKIVDEALVSNVSYI